MASVSRVTIVASKVYVNGVFSGKVRRVLDGFRANVTFYSIDVTVTIACEQAERKDWAEIIESRLEALSNCVMVNHVTIACDRNMPFKIVLPVGVDEFKWELVPGYNEIRVRGMLMHRDYRGVMVRMESNSLLPVNIALNAGVYILISGMSYNWSEELRDFVNVESRNNFNVASMCQIINNLCKNSSV